MTGFAFTPPIRRVNAGKGHRYIDVHGLRVPGVTTIISDGVPKPALIEWAGNATAEYAVDHWDDLTGKLPSVRLKELRGARYADRDTAANRGTQVHAIAERLIHGDEVAVPDGLEGHVAAYVRFLDEFDVEPVLVERVILSHRHGYAGTFDLIGDLIDPDDPEPDLTSRRRIRWLLDIKTSRSGVFGEAALQLAAYRYADVWMDGDEEIPMPDVERTGVVHVTAKGYELVPVVADEPQFTDFRYAQQISRFLADARSLVGAPIVSPSTSTYRLVLADDEVSMEPA